MAAIEYRGLRKEFPGGAVAVAGFELTIEDGEFLVLVGPSGSGKTTVLRITAGLEEQTAGQVLIGGEVVDDLAPMDRDIAMVFQSYALYPHMTVRDNMAFGLKRHKVAKPVIRERVDAAARMLGLEELLGRKPAQLSGGQRQRVAMGRAIVREPKAFLMDEPLSNLDAKLRVEMRAYLAELHQQLRTTTLYVTHDQTEAMTMGDRVAVMRDGVLQQVARPQELYERPENLFVAGFIGSPAMNLVRSRLTAQDGRVAVQLGEAVLPLPDGALARRSGLRSRVGAEVVVGIRPEDLEDAAFVPSANGSCLDVQVSRAEPLGAEVIAHFPCAAEPVGVAAREAVPGVTRGSVLTARLNPRTGAATGRPLRVAVDCDRLHFFDPETGLAIW
ncbi:MAG TPA: sn-glycerol-3-phosphate ABC transporter ATP-binding protein UgpC [Gaiellaceae bacterium]|nr:sn-glycerol-3-phosphate ABC transporter ATP-binding protein UgpC [Gaiellaceae bacterium]